MQEKRPTYRHYYSEHPQSDDYVFIFDGQNIYLDRTQQIPTWSEVKKDYHAQPLYCFAIHQNKQCFLAPVSHFQSNINLESIYLKKAWHDYFDNIKGLLSMRACHLNHWRQTHQYCGQCGMTLIDKDCEIARICLQCNLISYPKISPCIIVLITKGKEILLARSPRFNQGVYSLLAGFIEPGETAEEAIHREVFEEVSLKIGNVRYYISQPWPFPDSLMLGYIADYQSGEILIDDQEIEAASWFSIYNLPKLPGSKSLARQLINLYIHQQSA